jgi:hypothetical protein
VKFSQKEPTKTVPAYRVKIGEGACSGVAPLLRKSAEQEFFWKKRKAIAVPSLDHRVEFKREKIRRMEPSTTDTAGNKGSPMVRTRSSASSSTATIGFEAKHWRTADKLRSTMDAAEPSGARQPAQLSPSAPPRDPFDALFPEHFGHGENGLLPLDWCLVAIEEVCAINAWTLGKNDDLETLEYLNKPKPTAPNPAVSPPYATPLLPKLLSGEWGVTETTGGLSAR